MFCGSPLYFTVIFKDVMFSTTTQNFKNKVFLTKKKNKFCGNYYRLKKINLLTLFQ